MKVGISTWHGRISPVFDVAGCVAVFDVRDGEELQRQEFATFAEDPVDRAKLMVQLKIDTLICGAISKPLEEMLEYAGIRVIANISGRVEEVLQAFADGKLTDRSFAMPGVGNRKKTRHRGGKKAHKQ